MKNNFLILILLLAIVLTATFIYTHGPAPAAVSTALVSDAYPLYSGVQWNAPYPASMTFGTSTIAGTQVDSTSVINTSDLDSVFQPFEDYYQTKLSNLGWVDNTQFDAGGPGSGITLYSKGSEVIEVSYDSVFQEGGTSTPETCPCNITLHLLSSAQ